MVCKHGGVGPLGAAHHLQSQSPYGAKWFANWAEAKAFLQAQMGSQSPYGAKWFANFTLKAKAETRGYQVSQSPYGAKWFANVVPAARKVLEATGSQSPYGAKWFANAEEEDGTPVVTREDAIPLRG